MTRTAAEQPVLALRTALRNAAFARRSEVRYLAIPRTAWLGHPAPKPEPEPVHDIGASDDPAEPELRPLSRKTVIRLGGITTTLLYGVPTGALIGNPAGIAIGALAGVFGWLTGRALADEHYTRHHGDDVPEDPAP